MVTTDRTPFIGRQRELAALTAALDAARKGKGSVHIVAGEGGVGKTRITEGLRAKAEEHLGQLERICGRNCEEYQDLARALAAPR